MLAFCPKRNTIDLNANLCSAYFVNIFCIDLRIDFVYWDAVP